MARARCPNCGTEFDIVDWNGYHACKRHDENDSTVVGTLIPASEPKNTNKSQEKTMENFNGMNMDELASKVAMMIANGTAKATVDASKPASSEDGKFGRNSQFYGKKICGYPYSPFTVPRFTVSKFKEMYARHGGDYVAAVNKEVGYMDMIYFCIDELHRLSYMDRISLQERQCFWSVDDFKRIFHHYLNCVTDQLERAKTRALTAHRCVTYVKFRGTKYSATVKSEALNMKTVVNEITVDWKFERWVAEFRSSLERCSTYKELHCLAQLNRKSLVIVGNAYIKKYKGRDAGTEWRRDCSGYLLPKCFVEGYAKKGVFYAIKTAVMFGGVSVGKWNSTTSSAERQLYGREAVAYIKDMLENKKWEYFRFMAMYKNMYK